MQVTKLLQQWLSADEPPDLGVSPHLRWEEIQQRCDCRGRWVALRSCSFDSRSGKATAGRLVDLDDDLASLCGRLRDREWTDCAVLFCS